MVTQVIFFFFYLTVCEVSKVPTVRFGEKLLYWIILRVIALNFTYTAILTVDILRCVFGEIERQLFTTNFFYRKTFEKLG